MLDFYDILLMVSGVAMVLVAALVKGQSTGSRVLMLIAGVGFFGYGFYLRFIFEGGHYVVFYYIFALPIILIVNLVRGLQQRKAAANNPAAPAQWAGNQQWAGNPAAPGQWASNPAVNQYGAGNQPGAYPAPPYPTPGQPGAPSYPAPAFDGTQPVMPPPYPNQPHPNR